MAITKEQRQELIVKFRSSESDTGSAPVQCALLTLDIKHLTEHCKEHKKDFGTKRGLITKVGKRNRLLKYIKRRSYDEYIKLAKDLGIRLKKTDLISS